MAESTTIRWEQDEDGAQRRSRHTLTNRTPMSSSTTETRSAVHYERDADGIVLLTLDDPEQSANTMNRAYAESMTATVDRLEAEKDSITGVVVTSAKKTFFAGGDLNDLKKARKEDAAEVATMVRELKRDLRRGLATLCVGGGMGIATIVELV